MFELLVDADSHPDPLIFLQTFRTNKIAYQTLLQAVRYVLHEREINPPYHVVDIFRRHPYFDGKKHRTSEFSHRVTQPHRATREKVRKPATFSEDDRDPERDIEGQRNELLAMFDEDEVEDSETRFIRKLVQQFFSFALQSGDMLVCHAPVLFVTGGGYEMKEGGFKSDESVKSKFFAPDFRAQEAAKHRRGVKRIMNQPLD